MIIVTGAAGFIGSCLVRRLNDARHDSLILVDDYSTAGKAVNLIDKEYQWRIPLDVFPTWLEQNADKVSFVFHLGAHTDTTETNEEIFMRLNLQYSKELWNRCTVAGIPMVYASSAATYGAGELGYDDNRDLIAKLKPLNPYGHSKNDFDNWVLQQQRTPPHWAGLKFFNVYGPNEYHKGRMASVVFQTSKQIAETGRMKLFRSHRPDIADGHQRRDFIYVKDVTDVLYYFMKAAPASGVYNLGTGIARTFLDLATLTFHALDLEPAIDYIDIPADIRASYQYFTEAKIEKLRAAGYSAPFHSLEDGIADYVRNYLKELHYY